MTPQEEKEKEKKATTKSETALSEEKTLRFWKERDIFQKTLKKESPKGDFIFYEGPPTANGKPGIHHLEARAFKDLIPRYKTMRGFRVARKGGWDTHGLPVEIQVEKKLGLQSKKEIEAYGVEAFNKECKASVWEHVDLWAKFTDRIGFWVDLKDPYITYEKTYMESVWNIIKHVSEKKLLYKDYKVVPWCTRCGTGLSSHELAQGYEEVKDLSVYVKFKVKNKENTYFIAWTTTPWTLPGNVALAVGADIDYGVFPVENDLPEFQLKKGDKLIISDSQAVVNRVFEKHVPSAGSLRIGPFEKIKGKELVGLSYEPLFPYLDQKFKNKNPEAFSKAYKVYAADFVTTEDGTGVVHTAVMYGQEDFDLGTKIGLPKFHLVQEDGHFLGDMGFLSGRYVKEKTAEGKPTLDVDIIDDLKKRNLFFKQENYKHTYPHCWRCKTPLIYYARDSWYIRMSSLRDKLVKENKEINWEPEHIKEGRFGEWLKEVKDWAISRERYWGTPIPVWTDREGNTTVIGSVEELKNKIKKRNDYFLVRHGGTASNEKEEISISLSNPDLLTEKGQTEAKKAGRVLKKEKIDVIITSPYHRAKQTAEIIAKEIGFTGSIIEDARIGELKAEGWDGKTWKEYQSQFTAAERFTKHIGTAENWEDMRKRVAAFLYDIDEKYQGKKIALVGHGGPFALAVYASQGLSVKEMIGRKQDGVFKNGEVKPMDWRNLPHNADFEIDLHKPFIDKAILVNEKGNELKRVKEVLDVWLDSGAMPFAQYHYPFGSGLDKSNFNSSLFCWLWAGRRAKETGIKIPYPADFISEAIDQTRGWFYTLHAIGVLMDKGHAYKNVICLGHILDAQGKKMSKSLGNIIDPWLMMDKYGVDALRMWMYTVNQPGDSKNFDERTVEEIVKKVFNLLTNIITFYEMYQPEADQPMAGAIAYGSNKSTHILDRWIIARLHQMINQGSASLEKYNVFDAGRLIRDFVGDFSTWYIRRSRDRFKSDDVEDKRNALGTTKFVLEELAKYMAPFTPFFAEMIYQKLSPFAEGGYESIHLESWPKGGKVDTELLEEMKKLRDVVSMALDIRQKMNVKVRQPLSLLTIPQTFAQEYIEIIKDEVNVKDVQVGDKLDLNIEITPELKEEGDLREIIRAIQDLRKQKSLEPHQKISLYVPQDKEALIKKYHSEVKRVSNVQDVKFGDEMRIEII